MSQLPFDGKHVQGILLSKKEQDTKQSVGKLPFVQNKEERENDFFFFL